MITPSMLAFIISNFCQFSNPKISFESKMECGEAITNCTVKRDGLISNKSVNECRERWIEQQKRKTNGL